MDFKRILQAIARTGNPADPATDQNGQPTDLASDKVGRLVSVMNQVRELVIDDTTNVVRGTETVILAALAATYHDVVTIVGSNDSDQVISVSIRDVAAGAEILRISIPAGGVSTVPLYVPLPQTTVNTDWTAQLVGAGADISDSPINIFIQAVRNI